MNTQTHKNPVRLIIAVLAMTALITLACSSSNVQVYTPAPIVVDITLYEDEFNDLSMSDGVHLTDRYGFRLTDHYSLHVTDHYGVHISRDDGVHLTDQCQPLLDRPTRVELHEGYIRFVGTNLQPDGSEVEGSLDLSLTSENGQLKARIFAVDIPGVDLEDPCVVGFNQELEYAFSHMLDDTSGELLFKEVVVEEDVLRMKIQVNIN